MDEVRAAASRVQCTRSDDFGGLDAGRLHGSPAARRPSYPFFRQTLCDESQPTEVRIHIVKQLRNGRLAPSEFIDIWGVPASLGALALAADEPIGLGTTVLLRLHI